MQPSNLSVNRTLGKSCLAVPSALRALCVNISETQRAFYCTGMHLRARRIVAETGGARLEFPMGSPAGHHNSSESCKGQVRFRRVVQNPVSGVLRMRTAQHTHAISVASGYKVFRLAL